MPQDDRTWIPFVCNTAVPPYGLLEAKGTQLQDGRLIIQVRKYEAGNPPKVVFLNGPVAATADQLGARCTLANEYPAIARGTAAVGNTVGPSANAWTLGLGQPGFKCLNTGPVSNTMVVVREHGAYMARGQPTANVANTDATFTVSNCIMQSGVNVVASAAATLKVYNIFEDKIDGSRNITIIWNGSLERFDVQDVTCPNTA